MNGGFTYDDLNYLCFVLFLSMKLRKQMYSFYRKWKGWD